jgi:hypothetical protein
METLVSGRTGRGRKLRAGPRLELALTPTSCISVLGIEPAANIAELAIKTKAFLGWWMTRVLVITHASKRITVNESVSQFEPEPLVKSICRFARGTRSQIECASAACFCDSYCVLGKGFSYTLLAMRFSHNNILDMSS